MTSSATLMTEKLTPHTATTKSKPISAPPVGVADLFTNECRREPAANAGIPRMF